MLQKLGMTQQQAGKFFGYGKRSGQYWAANGPPSTLAMLLNVMDFLDLPANEVEPILRDTARRKSWFARSICGRIRPQGATLSGRGPTTWHRATCRRATVFLEDFGRTITFWDF
jgi:hypothetical protein